MAQLDRYRGNENILIVDDEPLVLTLARSILRHCGYKVYDFGDPMLAVSEFSRLPVDLVLTDVIMPNINGPALVKEVKASHPHIPCIFMSGYDLDQIKQHGIDAGCDYLRKPFTAEELLQRIRGALEPKSN